MPQVRTKLWRLKRWKAKGEKTLVNFSDIQCYYCLKNPEMTQMCTLHRNRPSIQEGPLKCEGCDALIIINDLEGKDNKFEHFANFSNQVNKSGYFQPVPKAPTLRGFYARSARGPSPPRGRSLSPKSGRDWFINVTFTLGLYLVMFG